MSGIADPTVYYKNIPLKKIHFYYPTDRSLVLVATNQYIPERTDVEGNNAISLRPGVIFGPIFLIFIAHFCFITVTSLRLVFSSVGLKAYKFYFLHSIVQQQN